MDDEIQWGQLEQSQPVPHTRPDQDPRYSVVACQSPAETDLPIYVDMDAMRELETHAASDTQVELGGVLLGGQYEDDAKRPFVVITNSLPAEHYESTQLSFKFTHETWSGITRRAGSLPREIRIVGWYHTHPGWGVFLSGMDAFICQHFFSQPLDVALVIDPCRGDRGFFIWSSRTEKQTLRAGGFFLIGPRSRHPELVRYSAHLMRDA